MVDINQLIDEVVGQVAAEEQSAPATEPTEPQPTAQSAQAPIAPVTPTPPPAPSVHSVGDMPISHPTPTEDAIQPQSAPTSLPPRQYVPSAHSIGDMPISHPSSYFADADAATDEDTHTDTVPPSTEALYPEALSSGEVPTIQLVAGDESGQATEPEQGAPNGQQPELVDMDGTTKPGTDNPDDPTAQYDNERYNVPRSYQEALRILDLQRSKPIYQSLMEGLGDPEAKRKAIDAYQARRNRYSGLVRLAEAIANTIDASGAQRNAYSQRRDPSYRYENDTQRELARQYADLQRTEGMLYNTRMRDAARYDRLSAEMRATESAGDQAARNEARYKQQLRQRAADAKRADEQARAAAEERKQRAADANAKWQAEMAMRDKQHRDRMGIERAKLAIRRNEQALKAARATAGGTKSSGTGGKGTTTTVYKRIPITLSDRVNGHISVPKDSPDYARKFFSDNFIESARKQMEVYNRHHAGDGKTYNSLPDYVQDQYGIDVMPLIGSVQCTKNEYQVAADKAAAIAMRDPETVLSYSVNAPFFGDNGYDADGVQVATDAIRERCGGYLNAISILNAANKSGLTYPQAFAIMYPNIYNSVVSAAQSGNKSDLAGAIKVLADGYNGVTYCRNYKDASQMVSWLLDTDALAERAPGFTEEDWGQ